VPNVREIPRVYFEESIDAEPLDALFSAN